MANKKPGETAGSGQVTFSKASAQRIADAVRAVEQGDRNAGPFVSAPRAFGGNAAKQFRVATFTGQWNTASTTTLTFFNVTTTPNTVTATNYHMPVLVASGQTAECAIAKSGTAWYLVSVNMTRLDGYVGNEIQVFGHTTATGSPTKWYSVGTCSTAVSYP